MSDATETVKFNVGGRHFEVSRALIDSHLDTVLGKLVSDTWHDDPDKAVFVDRDGDIFAQILNYLRYGSIELPINIPRSMFDQELDYYGITSAKGLITDPGFLGATMRSFVKAKSENEMLLLAVECYNQVFQSGKAFTPHYCIRIPKDHKLFGGPLAPEEIKLLVKYLDMYFGLTLHKEPDVRRDGNSFLVCTKQG